MNARAGWGRVSAAWALAIVAIAGWLIATPNARIRLQLQAMQFWWLEATFWASAACAVLIVRSLRRDLEARDLAAMAGLAALALTLTLAVAPRTNRIFYDEQIYQGIGQNMSDLRRAQMCNDGIVEYGRLECVSGEYNKQPYAYPHLLSMVYRLFGVSESMAFATNALVAAVTPAALYLFVLILFSDRTAAACAGLVLALTPHQAIWGATAAVEPSASLAGVWALLAAAWFCRSGEARALVAAVVITAYASQFRTESILLIPVVAGLIWQHRRAEFQRSYFWWAGLLGLVLVAPLLGHLYSVRDESWGSPDARLSFRYLAQNLKTNAGFFLGDERYPVLFTLSAVAGLMAPGVRVSRLPLVLYFSLFFGIGLFFYAGSYDYGADVRYSLMTYPPLSALAGLGFAWGVRWFGSTGHVLAPRTVLLAALFAQSLWYAPVVRATTEEAWAARADVGFAASIAPSLRGNRYVLTHNPAMFHVWGVNAGQMSMVVANPSHLEYLLLRYRGGVYLHWNFWCNAQHPAQSFLCEQAFALKPTTKVAEHAEREQRLGFYRIESAAELASTAAVARSPEDQVAVPQTR